MADRSSSELLKELMGMKKRMDNLYAKSLADSAAEPSADATRSATRSTWQPLMAVYETEIAWIAIMDLPGVAEENLDVKVERSSLIVEGMRPNSTRPAAGGTAILSERPAGKFWREVNLPEDLVADQIKAELTRGVLTVEIAKQAQPVRRIIVRHD